MKNEYKYFVIEIVIGALVGFFFLHPVSMWINGGWDAFLFCFKDRFHHLIFAPMSYYFMLIGMVLAGVTAISRITIQRKNILLEKQKNEIQGKNVELEQQKEEIQAQAENLQEANDEISEQNAEITAQKDLITKQHENLTASIHYAKLIQTAMLVTDEMIKTKLPNSFVLLLPRDIVSGDFYWVAEKDNYLFVAAVDCTGHGVPGAFMSMVGNQLLNQTILETNIYETNLILDEMNMGIKKFLKQDETNSRDGMDMSICRIDFVNKKIEFSGAANSLYLVQDNELIEIKADKKHIGGFSKEGALFTKHTIEFNQPTTFYLFTDGFADQSNKEFKKYGKINFKSLLKEISALNFTQQKERLIHEHNQWKQNQKQTDDILVIGFRI
jgi:phosphoserine phosphatase RsbU/P